MPRRKPNRILTRPDWVTHPFPSAINIPTKFPGFCGSQADLILYLSLSLCSFLESSFTITPPPYRNPWLAVAPEVSLLFPFLQICVCFFRSCLDLFWAFYFSVSFLGFQLPSCLVAEKIKGKIIKNWNFLGCLFMKWKVLAWAWVNFVSNVDLHIWDFSPSFPGYWEFEILDLLKCV